MVTCNISQFKEDRLTYFYSIISDIDQRIFTLRHSTTLGCFYLSGTYILCQPVVCSCELGGLATHRIYNTPANLSSPVTFSCASSNNNGILHTSVPWTPIVTSKYVVFRLNQFYYCKRSKQWCGHTCIHEHYHQYTKVSFVLICIEEFDKKKFEDASGNQKP